MSSNNYREVKSGPQYTIPIFEDNEGSSAYNLYRFLPRKIACASPLLKREFIVYSHLAHRYFVWDFLYQILQQKKISEIKSTLSTICRMSLKPLSRPLI